MAPRADASGNASGRLTAATLLQPNVLSILLLLVLALIVAARGPISRALGTAAPAAGTVAPVSAPSFSDAGTTSGSGSATGSGAGVGTATHVAAHHHSTQRHAAHNPFASRVATGGGLLGFVTPPAGWSLHNRHGAAGTHAPATAHHAATGTHSHRSAAHGTGSARQPFAPTVQPGTTSQHSAGGAPHSTGATPGTGCPSSASAYTVRTGDSLWTIAQRGMPHASTAKVAAQVQRIYHQNGQRIGSNPSLIRAGTLLCLPGQ